MVTTISYESGEMISPIPRPEHPRPECFRKAWINLNGEWRFVFDFGQSGLERGVHREEFEGEKIIVPFPPESTLSAVGYTDFIPAMFYRREICVPGVWRGKQILLHFGAVDCECRVFLDGVEVGSHLGGQTSFDVDLTEHVRFDQSQQLTLYVRDDLRSGLHGGGKQSHTFASEGCFYTRVTGIWQTVWLEAVAFAGLRRFRVVADYDNGAFFITPEFYRMEPGNRFKVVAFADGEMAGSASGAAADGIPLRLELQKKREWNPTDPFLYDLKLRVLDPAGSVVDEVLSYAGLRKICWSGNKLYLNNREIFLRFVLDQGFYPDGIWTAPDDASLRRDIELAMQAGFNGARLHQKVFEPRYHYWADKLGYLTWAEFGSWGINWSQSEARSNFLDEWREALLRDFNHPSIIGWTPLNESCSPAETAVAAAFPTQEAWDHYRIWVTRIYDLTKSLDPTRPVNDCSGYLHVKTDLWTVHAYREDRKSLKDALFPEAGGVMSHIPSRETKYSGQPYLNDEFGGFRLETPGAEGEGWGYYGVRITDPAELCRRIADQTACMIEVDKLAGYCYTQLTDVEQERNGLYRYDRSAKVPDGMLNAVFGKKPENSAW